MNALKNSISILKPDIFNFSECLHFLDRGYDDCLYTIEEDRIIKPLLIEGNQVLLQIQEQDHSLEVKILAGGCSAEKLQQAAGFVTRWFDLERDLHPFYRLLDRDERLSWMTGRFYGLRLMGIPDLFEALCWCVIGQQINLTFAHRLKRRLVETYGTYVAHDSKRHHYFPGAEVLAGLTVDELKSLQFSRQKAEYIIGIANEFAKGALTKQKLADQSDSRQMLNRLMAIRGVGEWTANYVLMKSLGSTDCITFGDTGLQSAVSRLLKLDRKPIRKEVEAFFKPFSGWESYLVIYLWRTLS